MAQSNNSRAYMLCGANSMTRAITITAKAKNILNISSILYEFLSLIIILRLEFVHNDK